MPLGTNAPNDCPAEPLKWKRMVSSGSPEGPWRRVSSLPVMVPTTRLVLRIAGELGAQPRVLRGDAHRAGVEVAGPHHDAAERDQGRGGEAELLGAEQRADHHVAARLELAVHLHADAAAEVVQDQHLMGL